MLMLSSHAPRSSALLATELQRVAMTTAPDREKVHGPTHDGEKICHIVPEDDPDTALCGKDVTGWPWNPPWPFCVVCLDLAGYEVG